MKTKQPHRPTKTRAKIDRCLLDLYFWLTYPSRSERRRERQDGYDHEQQLSRFMEQHQLGWSIIEDLRTLRVIDSVGKGRGQKTRWVGDYPTPELSDSVEHLREQRNDRLKRDLREDQQKQQQQLDDLLDQRNRIDQQLRRLNLNPQSRLF